jgi:hypothetical protein
VIDEAQIVRSKTHVVDKIIIVEERRSDGLILHIANRFAGIELKRGRAQHPEFLVTLGQRRVPASGHFDDYEAQRSRSEQERG